MSIHRSSFSPLTTPAIKPAAKASPAPVVSADCVHVDALDTVFALNGNHGGLGALRDNGDPLSLRVLLRQIGEVLCNGWDIVGVQIVRVSIRHGFGFVANDVVPIRRRLVEWILEELRNERRRERQGEGFVFFRGLFGQSHDRGNTHSQMEAADEVCLAVLHNIPIFFQVLDLVMVRRSEISAQAAIVACDDDTTSPRWMLVINVISHLQTSFLVGSLKDVCVLVLAYASKIDDRVCREHILRDTLDRCAAAMFWTSRYLCASCSVLCSTTSEKFGVSILNQLFIQGHVLFFRQDGIVRIESILLEERFISTPMSASFTDPFPALHLTLDLECRAEGSLSRVVRTCGRKTCWERYDEEWLMDRTISVWK